MTAPEADLTGWSVAPFTGGGYTHDVYRRGDGPGVVLIPELPCIHPGVLALGNAEVREVDGHPTYEARKRVVEFLTARLTVS